MNIELLHSAVLALAALVLLTSFAQLAQLRMVPAIHAFAWQGALVAATTTLIATAEHDPALYVSASLTLLLKAILIPWLLHRLVRQLDLRQHRDALGHPILVTALAVALVIFSYWLVLPIIQQSLTFTRKILGISLAVVLLGFFMMVVRHHAVSQVRGFMSMENGLFLAAVSATNGMPLVVELGIAFDVLIAMVLFGVFFLELEPESGLADIDQLNRLDETRKPGS